MWVIVNSPFGKALQAIRDNETRAEFVGVQIWRYRFVAFLVSGVFTGLAGALWVPLNGLTTPDIIHWSFSRSEEHTSELQSRLHLVCRLLLEKKKKNKRQEIRNMKYTQ